MKSAPVLLSVITGLAFAQGETNAKEYLIQFREFLGAAKDTTKILTDVNDKSAAEGAISKLDETGKRLVKASSAMEILSLGQRKDFWNEVNKNGGQVAKESLGIRTAFQGERGRLLKRPELRRILLKSQAWAKYDVGLEVKSLGNAVMKIYDKSGSYPASLADLTVRQQDGSSALLTEKELVDPWGRAYRYNPKTCHPITLVPLIWSDGSNPNDPNGKIINWALPENASKK